MNYISELLSILNEMSAYLLLGFFISGVLHIYVPKSLYARFLQGKGVGSVFRAALLGVPLPLCSCGVIPTAVSLKKEGASDGAVVSFLVATPQTGVDSILVTYSLLGLPFAIIRPVASFIVALFSGVMVDMFGVKSGRYEGLRVQSDEPKPSCGCGCQHNSGAEPKRGWMAVFNYGYITLMQDFGKWLVIGLMVAAAITAFIPDDLFMRFSDHYLLSLLLILAISTPMYICATGSIPIALSLMLKGLSPGAAFVLLMAGPATNFASLIILKREIGVKKMMIYLASIIVGAIAFAIFIDYALPAEWFAALNPLASHDGCCDHNHAADHAMCSHGPVWWQTTTSVIFLLLFANAMIRKYRKES